jgi:hypothetical protein
VQKFVGGPVAATIQETVPGPNAEENIRRINAELAVMRAELEAAKVPTAAITDELDEQASKTEERKNQQKQLKQLSLEIQEAEAAGNQALADDLREYESLVKAAIDYEGDLEMAARDVNAAHKERVRLQQEALQKSIEQVEKEVQLAEAMAFGTDEAKSRAEWMKVYESTMAKTGREDLAQRAANAATADTGGRSRGGGTSGGSREGDSSMTFNERVAEMRGNTRAQRDDELAQSYEARGFFRNAVRAQDRADRRRNEAMERGRMKDHLQSMGFNNMGEAFSQYERDVPLGERMTEREFKEFQKQMIEQGKTPEERAREEEEARAKQDAKGGKSDLEVAVNNVLSLLKTHIPSIDEKLPQTALVYS